MTDGREVAEPDTQGKRLGYISAYGLEKLQTRNHYCVSVSNQAGKEYVIPIFAETPPPQTQKMGWQSMATAPTDGTVINVVGRYLDASAGFPRYAGFNNGHWVEYSRFAPQPLVCWAWKPRGDWPQEGEFLPSTAPQEHGWEEEFNALSPEEQGKIRHCADTFGVPLIAAYYRAKDLDVIKDAPSPEPMALGPEPTP